MTHHDDRAAFKARESADDGGIVAEQTIAVQLRKVVQQQLAPVARVRALGMPRELRALPRRQARVGALALAQLSAVREQVVEEEELVDERLEEAA